MRNDPGCARPGRRALALLALSVLVTACSLTSMAYNHATRLITWKIDEFFSLDAGQDAEVRMRLDRVLAWHRARQLPDYARFLGQVRDRLRGPVTPADVAWLYGAGAAVVPHQPMFVSCAIAPLLPPPKRAV